MKPYPFRIEQAKLTEVIQLRSIWGNGTEEDPAREVQMFFSKSGTLLAISDPVHPHERMMHDRVTGM